MLGPSHARIGFAVGAAVGHALGAEAHMAVALPRQLPTPVGSVVALIGMAAVCGSVGAIAALLPDLDSESTLGAILPRWWHALTPGHRGLSHSLLAVLAWWGASAVACSGLGIAGSAALLLPALIVAGVVSHLAADALTDHGICPLYPLRWHLRSPLAFRTGSWPEPVAVALTCAAAAAFVVAPLVHGGWV